MGAGAGRGRACEKISHITARVTRCRPRRFCRPPAAGTDRKNPLFMRLCTEYAYLPAIDADGTQTGTKAHGDKRSRIFLTMRVCPLVQSARPFFPDFALRREGDLAPAFRGEFKVYGQVGAGQPFAALGPFNNSQGFGVVQEFVHSRLAPFAGGEAVKIQVVDDDDAGRMISLRQGKSGAGNRLGFAQARNRARVQWVLPAPSPPERKTIPGARIAGAAAAANAATASGSGAKTVAGGWGPARARRFRGLTAGMEIESYPQTAGEVKFWGFSALFSARRGAAGVVSGAYTSRRTGGTSARRWRTARADSSRTWPPKSLNCTGRRPRRW